MTAMVRVFPSKGSLRYADLPLLGIDPADPANPFAFFV